MKIKQWIILLTMLCLMTIMVPCGVSGEEIILLTPEEEVQTAPVDEENGLDIEWIDDDSEVLPEKIDR